MKVFNKNIIKKLISVLLNRYYVKPALPNNNVKFIEDLQSSINYILKQNLEDNELRTELISELKGTTPVEAFYIIHALHQVKEIDGDICELGIAQGDTSVLIANEIRKQNKTLWLFDSFEGLPKPTKEDILIDDVFNLGDISKYEGTMAFPDAIVKQKINKRKLTENKINIVPGFINEEYQWPKELKKVSFAYIDFDFYLPIKIALEFLHNKISRGGIIIVDDYDFFSSGAKKAVDEFLDINRNEFSQNLPFKNLSKFIIIRKN